jgi:cyclic beta-1,2-glucan synthetase
LRASNTKMFEGLLRVGGRFGAGGLPRERPDEELPLRSELFSADQMEQYGKTLAAAHKLSTGRATDHLLARLAENEVVLVGTCDLLTAAVKDNRRITPAGEWLLDNFYLIEEQIRTATRHLPKGYSRELPRLAQGPSARLPRVYDIALETIAHGDGRVDAESLSRFVAAYQTVMPLKLGELWGIPIMLRLALIENLRRVATRIARGTLDRNEAEAWADQMMDVAEHDPTSLILIVADMARSNPPMVSSFVAELARRLQGQTPALALSLTWIEHRLSESGLSIERMVQSETQKQAADQVTISNSIGSLRILGSIDWREFVETMSLVDQKLREDPANIYGGMDFATRDRYRHVIERIAKSTRLSESEVARKAVQLAHDGSAGADDRGRHVGYYLIDRGLSRLERTAESRLRPLERLRRTAGRTPLFLYLGAIALFTAVFTGLLLEKGHADGLDGWVLAPLGVLAALCTSHLAAALVNWLVTLLATPDRLPRMDYSTGIPPEFRTLAVVPTMLVNEAELDALLEALEVRFLANQDSNLLFGLLTDFPDAQQERLPGDEALSQRARAGIDALNEKYRHTRNDGDDTFFLFHRARRWNPEERVWMGYERKRGKLEELNSLLRGGAVDRFSHIAGNIEVLSSVTYVITLDTDTQLPRDTARELVGAMAHPLNRPRYDERRQRVVAGYGILQPRMAVSLSGANRSLYARLCSSEPGIDPYTRVVSDVYQDLFGEGSFVGKGIYDVDAFRRTLGGRLPENRILSHDLLEGCYVRSGLLSDVQLYEETPSRYSADVSRRHRWIRGDYQIAQWVLPRLFVEAAGSRKNLLSGLSRWKIFDNLRRSLVAAALTILLLAGWTVLSSPALWTLVVLGIILIPPLSVALLDLFRKPDEASLSQHFSAALLAAGTHFSHAGLMLACLPYEAFFSVDAMLRTGWRMLVTHHRLLEWSPSLAAEREAEHPVRTDLFASCRTMWFAPTLAVATASALAVWNPVVLVVAGPIVCLWFSAPAIIWWISRPLIRRDAQLSAEQNVFLQKIARKTWMFFETFVGPEDHWLPPDNYQEHPVAAVAHRTSPTNMGLALLANLAAYDFGYIAAGELVERTSNALRTMRGLDRYQGHFYNWYDTQSLQPLVPLYVSSVDSGNLAGHLLTLRAGLSALPDEKVIGLRLFEGLSDTLQVLADTAGGPDPVRLAQLRKDLDSAYDSRPATADAMWRWLDRLAHSALGIFGTAQPQADVAAASDARRWVDAFVRQCQVARDELTLFTPWRLLLAGPAVAAGLTDQPGLRLIPTLRELAELDVNMPDAIDRRLDATAALPERERLAAFREAVTRASQNARDRIAAIEQLVVQVGDMVHMDYGFLYDQGRHLLAIGYNVSDRRRDAGYYDLLASEARLSSFVAIAQGKLPQDTWFALGRLLTRVGGETILLSWSGSMFEYLMPLLVMPTFENTLLDQTYHASVTRQIAYGNKRGVPWGMSESGYNAVDAALSYQYRAFGAPGLGLQRGLADDLVIAPYAAALALMVAPEAACANLQRLALAGLEGQYGLYEAVDYTPAHVPRGQTFAIVRSFMAHHQGMSLLSLAYLLRNRPMQRRFASDPQFQATMLLLQERIPRVTALFQQPTTLSDIRATTSGPEMPMRVLATADTPIPEVQLLSNGRYHVMVSNAGGGYSRWKDLAVTRWREDGTCDNWGTFCYIRDVASGEFWSFAHQPTLKRATSYEAIFSEARAEFRRRDAVEGGEYDTHTEIVVSPEDDIELRRMHVTNRSRARRTIDVTSYAEVVLATPAADAVHPAFSNLFVQTEIVAQRHAILCTRRPRSREERPPWMLHLMVVHGADVGEISYETDRARFIGRGYTVAAPQAMRTATALSGSAGSVLDPIVAIRYRIMLDPDQSAVIDVVTGVGDTRDAALSLIGKYQDRHLADRVFDLAWTHSWVALRQINATETDAQLYGRLAGSVIYANASLRAATGVLAKNRRGQSGLWSYAISGDWPIVLLQIGDAENIDLVRQLVQAHAYWRLKGLAVDLVIWNEDRAGYRQLLQEQIMGLIAAGVEAHLMDRPGGIFVRRAEQIADEDRVLLQSAAHAIITDRRGGLAEQINRRGSTDARAAQLSALRFKPVRVRRSDQGPAAGPDITAARRDLLFFNGLGGFTPDGREYVIRLGAGHVTPAPWVNVLANQYFGTVISEAGLAYTWSENAHQFRLTPWDNDPVSDAGGEAFFLRDEETGQFWSPTPLPCCGTAPYVTRHGFGYSIFEHAEEGIVSELTVYVDLDAPVKYAVLKVKNDSGRLRRVSATSYVEWVLGELRANSLMHVITEIDPASGALCARNAYNTEFPGRMAFLDVDEVTRTQSVTVSGDRTEFLGRNGTLKKPAAMFRSQLSNRVGAAMDPCAAIQVAFDLAEGQEREIVFRLGAGSDAEEARKLTHRFRGSAAAKSALEKVRQYWRHTLGAVQVETPDPAVNVLTNGWLVYQTLACRVWARSGFYQSGGAYGFRDQLQDVMALVHTEPRLAREHLLRCAAHQFRDGDVQHWWHPPLGRGVRTKCSDDYLWLPLATARYIETTGDTGVLHETSNFLEGRPVGAEEDSYYDMPGRSDKRGSLYEHCASAILNGLHFGEHGLPLMGSGDWNDGMNLVGIHGKGESVWLGFFLYEVLNRFVGVARLHGDLALVERCQTEALQLRRNIEQHGWDGQWYRRAYFDDGTALGSAASAECQIDSIAQSWSVLSGAGDPQRSRMAMNAVDQRLVRRDDELVQLLTPPFDHSNLNPGYIRGYVPGVRENGGQYTHAAVWAAMAFAALGDSKRAWELATLINPLHHASTPEGVATYKVEPYVVAADVYAVSPHTGRGGWTWYTGSAGWMYRLILESLLGVRLEVDELHFTPCLPAAWTTFTIAYRYRETVYHITVVQTPAGDGDAGVTVDGIEQPGSFLLLIDDRQDHVAEVRVRGRPIETERNAIPVAGKPI